MAKSESRPERPFEYSLVEALKDRVLKGKEAKIIGEMLVEFFETEALLDACIAAWFYPVYSERYNALDENILIYTPLSKKLEAAKNLNIIPESVIIKYFKIADRRNLLAHRRTKAERTRQIISEEYKDKFIKECRDIRSAIFDKVKIQVDELKRYYEDLYITIPTEAIKRYLKMQKEKGNNKEGA